TTTKEAIADVLELAAPTFRSWRNYNDLLGVPLSLGRLEPTQAYAVIELGADRPGEIAELCAVVRPQMGVVTSLSAAHLLYFGSVEAYAGELASLLRALPVDGIAILGEEDGRLWPHDAASAARVLRLTAPEAAVVGAAPLVLRLPADGRAEPTMFPHLVGV